MDHLLGYGLIYMAYMDNVFCSVESPLTCCINATRVTTERVSLAVKIQK